MVSKTLSELKHIAHTIGTRGLHVIVQNARPNLTNPQRIQNVPLANNSFIQKQYGFWRSPIHTSSRRAIGLPPELSTFLQDIDKQPSRFEPGNDTRFAINKSKILLDSVSKFYKENTPLCELSGRNRLPWYRQENIDIFEKMEPAVWDYWGDGIQDRGEEVQRANKTLEILKSAPENREDFRSTPAEHCRILVIDPALVTNPDTKQPEKDRKGATTRANGLILINQKIVKALEDDQLAFVIAHELSHAMLQHTAEVTSFTIAYTLICHHVYRAMITNMGECSPDEVEEIAVDMVPKIREVFLLKDTTLELEADRVGLNIMSRAKYELSGPFDLLIEMNNHPERKFGGGFGNKYIKPTDGNKVVKEDLDRLYGDDYDKDGIEYFEKHVDTCAYKHSHPEAKVRFRRLSKYLPDALKRRFEMGLASGEFPEEKTRQE